jgi:hypothetical protein
MKILYSAGNRLGAATQLARFRAALPSDYQLKIAAFSRSSECCPTIDWTLDALFHPLAPRVSVEELLGHAGAPKVNAALFEILVRDVDEYDPDLVICDGEAVLAHLAHSLQKPLWYCSPLHLLDGVVWDRGQLRYQARLETCRKFLKSLPPASQYWIYSPWGSAEQVPPLRENYNWIQPYVITAEPNMLSKIFDLAVCPDRERSSILAKILNSVSEEVVFFNESQLHFSHLKKCELNIRSDYSKYVSDCKWAFLTGETSFLADVLYNAIYRVCLAPNLQDPETMLNAIMCQRCGWGWDVGQVEFMEERAADEILAAVNSPLKQPSVISLQAGLTPTLDQKVIEYACSL